MKQGRNAPGKSDEAQPSAPPPEAPGTQQPARIPPPSGNKWVRRGTVLAGRGDYIGAVSAFSQGILDNPADADAYVGRGKAFCVTGGYSLAMGDYNTALLHNPNSAAAYTERGILYFNMGDGAAYDRMDYLRLALRDLNRALEIDPSFAEAYGARSVVHAALEGEESESTRSARAVHDAYMAIQLNPNLVGAKV